MMQREYNLLKVLSPQNNVASRKLYGSVEGLMTFHLSIKNYRDFGRIRTGLNEV